MSGDALGPLLTRLAAETEAHRQRVMAARRKLDEATIAWRESEEQLEALREAAWAPRLAEAVAVLRQGEGILAGAALLLDGEPENGGRIARPAEEGQAPQGFGEGGMGEELPAAPVRIPQREPDDEEAPPPASRGVGVAMLRWIRDMGSGAWCSVAQVAIGTGHDRDKTSKMLTYLRAQGRLVSRPAPNGEGAHGARSVQFALPSSVPVRAAEAAVTRREVP